MAEKSNFRLEEDKVKGFTDCVMYVLLPLTYWKEKF